MPTPTQILYALFILLLVIIVGWFLLEALDRLDDDNPNLIVPTWLD